MYCPYLLDLKLVQMRDEKILTDAKFMSETVDYRRKRSLKFRAKMRAQRSRIFNDPFHKKDRNHKNPNKVIAAKRRQRDDSGKFNFEAVCKDEPEIK